MNPDPNAEWWNTTEVGAYLGVKRDTVSKYRHAGRMPEPREQRGRSPLWKPNDVIEWHRGRPRPGAGGRPRNDDMLTPSNYRRDQPPLPPAEQALSPWVHRAHATP